MLKKKLKKEASNKSKYSIFFILILFISSILALNAQVTPKKVLFLGNSYTAYNNLPAIISAIASADGDSITYVSITPGGQYLQAHANDQQVIAAFQQGGWDFIVAQEQSQIPVIPYFRESLMYPGAASLKALRDQYSPGAAMYYFMTWGRQNGGQQCNDIYCSHAFTGFFDYQDTLSWAYYQTAVQTACGMAPVGEIWREVMLQHQAPLPPLNLFSTDGSHPSAEGSYLAALTIYSTLFNKLVSNLPYVHAGVDSLLDVFFKQITDANLWPRYSEWNLSPLVSYKTQTTNSLNPVIYPNPASEILHISTDAPFDFIEIYDIYGRSVRVSRDNPINISALAKGIYIAIIHSENKRFLVRFIVE